MAYGCNRESSPSLIYRKNYRINMIAARQRMNLSQAELAEMVHMSRSRIAGIETGWSDPTLKTAKEIAEALNMSDYRELEETFEFDFDKEYFIGSNGTVIRVSKDTLDLMSK